MRTNKLLGKVLRLHNVIVAPHADDELIGCFELLNSDEDCTVALPDTTPENRVSETKSVLYAVGKEGAHKNVCKVVNFTRNIEIFCKAQGDNDNSINKQTICWFPDPRFERHPEHTLLGQIGLELFRTTMNESNIVVGFYSINMNAPYVYTLPELLAKRKKELCGLYDSQTEYFKQHQESWVFEGRCML